jgi:hypothetical protein
MGMDFSVITEDSHLGDYGDVYAPDAYGQDPYADLDGDDFEPDEWDDEELLEFADEDGGVATPDGCWVEPDGVCPHGERSPLLVRGLI